MHPHFRKFVACGIQEEHSGLIVVSGRWGIPLRVGERRGGQEWNPPIPAWGRQFIIDPCHGKSPMVNLWSAKVLKVYSEGAPLCRAEVPQLWSRTKSISISWEHLINASSPAPPRNHRLEQVEGMVAVELGVGPAARFSKPSR